MQHFKRGQRIEFIEAIGLWLITRWGEYFAVIATGVFLPLEIYEITEKVTAFRPEMAVHGRYGKPCPVCGDPVQHIVHAENETNYCATCQTGGKLLADRALSRLLREDWPKTPDELESLTRDAKRK